MSYLCIIPASAVADPDLTDTQVRVLAAIGTFTNRLGGNVWASVSTLAKQCNLNPRSVQRALPVLIAHGYLKHMPRTGRTTIYEVVLQGQSKGVTQESLGGDLVVTPPLTTQSPKRLKERLNKTVDHPALRPLMEDLWEQYPKRLVPHVYAATRTQVVALLSAGVSPIALYNAAMRYAAHTVKEGTEPKFIKSMHGFFTDDYWRGYDIQTVQGRTREEWARSGQDVAEFDRLVGA